MPAARSGQQSLLKDQDCYVAYVKMLAVDFVNCVREIVAMAPGKALLAPKREVTVRDLMPGRVYEIKVRCRVS